jgi:hypothetical protein
MPAHSLPVHSLPVYRSIPVGRASTRCASGLAAAMAVLAFAATPLMAETMKQPREPNAEQSAKNTSGKTAFLGFRFISGATPMTPEEGARLIKIEDSLKTKLEASGRYSFVTVPAAMRTQIEAGQPAGECGGCEMQYANELGAGQVAWGTVQKVSNLILNVNVYMADVATNKMTFVKSVDIRGNTDETWEQGIGYMVKRYILGGAKAAQAQP